jgi:hypothetical protein
MHAQWGRSSALGISQNDRKKSRIKCMHSVLVVSDGHAVFQHFPTCATPVYRPDPQTAYHRAIASLGSQSLSTSMPRTLQGSIVEVPGNHAGGPSGLSDGSSSRIAARGIKRGPDDALGPHSADSQGGLSQRLLTDVFGRSRAGTGAVVRRVAKVLGVPGSLDQIDAEPQDRKKAFVTEIWFDPPANAGARITVSASADPAGSQVITHR